MLKDDKAIVSDIHGTTRDSIEDVVNLSGVAFRFIDTAGIRHTDDTIESLGIERSYKKMGEADIVLLVIDSTQKETVIKRIVEDIMSRITDQKLLVLFNKADLLSECEQAQIKTLFRCYPFSLYFCKSKHWHPNSRRAAPSTVKC